MTISKRIKYSFVAISLLSVILTSIFISAIDYNLTVNAIEEEKKTELKIFRDMKAFEIENYFNKVKEQLLSFSNNPLIFNAMRDFEQATNSYAKEIKQSQNEVQYKEDIINYYLNDFLKEYLEENGELPKENPRNLLNFFDESSFALQYYYILKNPYSTDLKNKLNKANDGGTTYSNFHEKYHPGIRRVMQKLGFYDIFLIDLSGRVVYTVEKGLDFGVSLENSILKNTNFGKVFRAAKNSTYSDFTVLSDFSSHLPSFDNQSAFIGTPIVTPEGKKIGVLVFEISLSEVNKIMTNNENWKEIGLGNTGEIYIVGEDFKSKSISRFVIQDLPGYLKAMKQAGMSEADLKKISYRKNNIGIQINKTQGTIAALNGESGVHIYKDYRGEDVIAAYKPLNIPGLNWVILAEIDEKEVFAEARKISYKMLAYASLVAIFMTLISILIGNIFSKGIIGPIRKFSNEIVDIADTKDLTKRVKSDSKDEFLDMEMAINKLLDSFQKICQNALQSSHMVQEKADQLMALSKSKPTKEEEFDYQEDLEEVSSDLSDLCDKLENLSTEFKFLEHEAEKRSDW